MRCEVCKSKIVGYIDSDGRFIYEEIYKCENCNMYCYETITGNTSIWLRPFRFPALAFSYNIKPTRLDEFLFSLKLLVTRTIWMIRSLQ